MSLSVTAFAETNYIELVKSELATSLEQNFEFYGVGRKYNRIVTRYGKYIQEVKKEDNNSFLRIKNNSSTDSRVQIKLDKKIKGQFIIEYDIRINKMLYMQMPTVVGVTDAGKINTDLTRLVLSSNKTVSINNNSIGSWQGASDEWQKIAFYIDTENDVCRCLINGAISAEAPALVGINEVVAFDFLLRGESQYIDLDNIKVYHCKLNVESSSDEEASTGLPLPVRRERPAYQLTKFNNAPMLDAKLYENWNFNEMTRILEGDSDTKAEFAAGYTDEGLYVALKASDSNLLGGNAEISTWLQDCFEIFIDGENEKTANYQDNDMQLMFVYDLDMTSILPEGVEYKSGKTDDGWCVEVFIPASLISENWLADGYRIGMDFGYNNCAKTQGVRDLHLMWRGSNRNSVSTTAFGEGVFK